MPVCSVEYCLDYKKEITQLYDFVFEKKFNIKCRGLYPAMILTSRETSQPALGFNSMGICFEALFVSVMLEFWNWLLSKGHTPSFKLVNEL